MSIDGEGKSSMNEVVPGIYAWSRFSEELGFDFTGYAVRQKRRNRRTAKQAVAERMHSRGWRCYGWRKVMGNVRLPRSGGRWARQRLRWRGLRCCRRSSRSHSASAIWATQKPSAVSWNRSRRGGGAMR